MAFNFYEMDPRSKVKAKCEEINFDPTNPAKIGLRFTKLCSLVSLPSVKNYKFKIKKAKLVNLTVN